MVDPSAVTNLATAYWGSMVLLTANRLEVFTTLASGALAAEEIAKRCGAQPRSMSMLLDACVGQALLLKEDGRYRNTEVVETYLVRGKRTFLGDALRYAEDLYPAWGRLTESVRSDKPAVAPESILGGDPEKTRNFVLGMHNRALGVAATLAQTLDLTGRSQLLDVGGGPATYSILLANKTPNLRSRVLDLPAVTTIAKEIIAQSGCSDRVDVLVGDYHTAAFPGGNDAVLMSGIMHRETEASCRELLRKAYGALQPGGMLVVADVFFDNDDKTSPPFTGLFALTMMLTADNGGAHAQTQMAAWMAESGFGNIRVNRLLPMPHVVITADKV